MTEVMSEEVDLINAVLLKELLLK